MGHVWVDIRAARPGAVIGHGHAELDRLRAELEELTGKPVRLNMAEPGPWKGPEDAGARAYCGLRTGAGVRPGEGQSRVRPAHRFPPGR
jgi:hypothetical protein